MVATRKIVLMIIFEMIIATKINETCNQIIATIMILMMMIVIVIIIVLMMIIIIIVMMIFNIYK